MPPLAQSLPWIFIEAPVPERDTWIASLSSETLRSPSKAERRPPIAQPSADASARRTALASVSMGLPREHDVSGPGGRTLRVLEAGAPDGPALVAHHGTPGARPLYRLERESAEARGLRL